jgi:hypothetical protein
MMSTTKYFIGNFVGFVRIADNYLFTFGNHYSVYRASVVRRSLATPAECFDLQRVYSIS